MKHIVLTLLVALPFLAVAQVNIPKDANRFTYHQYDYGDRNDTTVVTVIRDGQRITILTPEPEGEKIQGYCNTVTTVDYATDSITVTAAYDDSTYYYRTAFSRSDLEWKREGAKWQTSINSNTLVFEMNERAPVNANPLPHYGLNKGVLLSFSRNGQLRMKLVKAEKVKGVENGERSVESEGSSNAVESLSPTMSEPQNRALAGVGSPMNPMPRWKLPAYPSTQCCISLAVH